MFGRARSELTDQERRRDVGRKTAIEPGTAALREIGQERQVPPGIRIRDDDGGQAAATAERARGGELDVRRPRRRQMSLDDGERPGQPIGSGRRATAGRPRDGDRLGSDVKSRQRHRGRLERLCPDRATVEAEGFRGHLDRHGVAGSDGGTEGPNRDRRAICGEVLGGDRRVDEERQPDRNEDRPSAGLEP